MRSGAGGRPAASSSPAMLGSTSSARSSRTCRPAALASGSGDARSTSNASTQSSNVRAIGPTWSNDGARGHMPSAGTLP